MLSISCPSCKSALNPEGKVPEVFKVYICPYCSWKGILNESEYDDLFSFDSEQIDDEEEDDNEFDEEEIDEEEDDESEIMANASYCAATQICSFLKSVINESDKYRISGADILVLSKMCMVLTDLNRYTVNGYLYFTVKDYGKSSMAYHEIHIDSDGLRLTYGVSYVDKYSGYEQESRVVFPFENEYEAVEVDDKIGEFVDSVSYLLLSEERDVEAFDSGDPIEDND